MYDTRHSKPLQRSLAQFAAATEKPAGASDLIRERGRIVDKLSTALTTEKFRIPARTVVEWHSPGRSYGPSWHQYSWDRPRPYGRAMQGTPPIRCGADFAPTGPERVRLAHAVNATKARFVLIALCSVGVGTARFRHGPGRATRTRGRQPPQQGLFSQGRLCKGPPSHSSCRIQQSCGFAMPADDSPC